MEKAKLVVEEADLLMAVEDVAEKINSRFSGEDVTLVCVLKGAAYFTVDLSRMLDIKHSVYFIDASSYDGQKRTEVFIPDGLIPEKFIGKKVIILDELIDSGHTLFNIKKAFLEFMSEEDVTTCVAMNKVLCGKEKIMEADIIGIDVPDVWLVGYGLDDNGYHRNSMHVYAVPKVVDSDKTDDDIRIFGS